MQSTILMTQVFAAVSVMSVVVCCLLEVAMVNATNRKMEAWQTVSSLGRDITVTLKRHRRLYPGSRLRIAFVLSACVLTGCIAGLIAIHWMVYGL